MQKKLYRCGTETGDCSNRRVMRNICASLEESLRKGVGYLEDVVFKK
jgi:hypothetical protein